MRIISGIIALGWLCMFVGLFFGYDPSRFEIGCAFFIATITLIRMAVESE